MTLVAKENNGAVELHDEVLGLHMYNASPSWKRGEYNLSFAPEAKKVFPHLGEHPEFNFGHSPISSNKKDLPHVVNNKFHNGYMKKGLKPEYTYNSLGETGEKGGYGHNIQAHEMFNREGKKVATVHSISSDTGPTKHPRGDIHKTIIDKNWAYDIDLDTFKAKTPNFKTAKDLHLKMNTGNSLRGKKPTFIGTVVRNGGNHKEYKHSIDPAEASEKFQVHMQNENNHIDFERHSPNHFTFKSGYQGREEHHVIATPGKIIHTKTDTSDYATSKNTTIFESLLLKKYTRGMKP